MLTSTGGMGTALVIEVSLSTASLLAWAWLTLDRGLFWRTDQTPAFGSGEAVANRRWPSFGVAILARERWRVEGRAYLPLRPGGSGAA